MKLFIPILLALTVPLRLDAADETWYKGTIVLGTDAVIEGELSVDQTHQVVLLKKLNSISVYPAHKLQSVEYFDNLTNTNRKFISLRQHYNTRTLHLLFEVVLIGDISVLRTQKIIHQSLHTSDVSFEYFVKRDHELISIHKFRSQLYRYLIRKAGHELEIFIRSHKLNPNDPGDAIRIIEFFNQQQASAREFA